MKLKHLLFVEYTDAECRHRMQVYWLLPSWLFNFMQDNCCISWLNKTLNIVSFLWRGGGRGGHCLNKVFEIFDWLDLPVYTRFRFHDFISMFRVVMKIKLHIAFSQEHFFFPTSWIFLKPEMCIICSFWLTCIKKKRSLIFNWTEIFIIFWVRSHLREIF